VVVDSHGLLETLEGTYAAIPSGPPSEKLIHMLIQKDVLSEEVCRALYQR